MIDNLLEKIQERGPQAAYSWLALINSAPEPAFDRLTHLAAHVLNTPISVISLLNSECQYLKSSIGLSPSLAGPREIPLAEAFGRLEVASREPLAVKDVRSHRLLMANRALREMKAVGYLSLPLITSDQQAVGTLCVVDTKPRDWSRLEMAILSDLAAAVVTEIDLRSEVSERRLAEQRLATQYAISRLLGESHSLEEAAPRLLQAICEGVDWDLGALWKVDSHSQRISCLEIWRRPHLQAGEFERLTWQVHFPPGVGLPGRIWESHQPAWLVNALVDKNFPRAQVAAKEGLHSAFGFPILLDDEVLAVAEFFSREIRQPDADLLQMAAATGSQIGQFVERQLAEQALRQSEARKTALLEASLDCVITIDEQGCVVETNSAVETMFGYTPEQMLGHAISELIIPPSFRQQHQHGMARYRATGESQLIGHLTELTAMRADGSEFPVELVVTHVPSNGSALFTAQVRDITRRKQTEATLSTRVRQQAAVAEFGQRALSSSDLDGLLDEAAHLVTDILDVEFCKILELLPDGKHLLLRAGAGWKPGLVGHTLVGAGRDSQAGYALLSHQPVIVHDLRVDKRLTAPPLLHEHGVISGISVIIHGQHSPYGVLGAHTRQMRTFTQDDVNFLQAMANVLAIAIERKQAEDELHEAVRARDQFLSVASHELKTPITSLLGYAELFQRRARSGDSLSERDQRALRVIVEQANRLNKLIMALLDLSRIQNGQLSLSPAPLDLGVLVQQVVSEMQLAFTRADITVSVPEQPVPVQGDELRLEQVVQNLLQNAIKYSPDGGPIRVKVEARDGRAILSVSDQGIGIPGQSLARIFTRFYRAPNVDPRHISGLGIGLYVVQQIAALHGGEILVESEEGKGSTFTVLLPMTAGG